MPTARPMSRITELIDSSTRMTWLKSAVSPSAAATAVMPSSSGMPAATSAPKATTRISSVTGSEVISARWKSFWMRFMIALLALASPNSPTNSSGGLAARRPSRPARARRDPWRVRIAGDLEGQQRRGPVLGALALVAALQRRLDLRDRRHARQARDELVDGGAVLAAQQPAAAALDEHLLGRALGGNCCGQHLVGRQRLAVAHVLGFSVTVPTAPPITNATTTKASQPSTAVLRCAALQRAARAANVVGASVTLGGAVRDAIRSRP